MLINGTLHTRGLKTVKNSHLSLKSNSTFPRNTDRLRHDSGSLELTVAKQHSITTVLSWQETSFWTFFSLTSSHLMNFPPFFRASWTLTGLSCNAWTPGLAPAMARDCLPGCQRLNPAALSCSALLCSEGTKPGVLHFHSGASFLLSFFSGETVLREAGRRGSSFLQTLTFKKKKKS